MGRFSLSNINILPPIEDRPALPIGYILPGLVFIILLDLLTVFQLEPWAGYLNRISFWALAVLPWGTILVAKRSAKALGYRSDRALLEYCWGILFGAIWRGLSLGLNIVLLSKEAALGLTAPMILSALVVVPIVEETFYRGYLTRSLATKIHPLVVIILQSVLFALNPVHYSQGFPALISIFGFGLLAGALILWRKNIWSVLGAHGFANTLPAVLLAVS